MFDHIRPRGAFRRWLARRDAATIVRLLTPRANERALDVGCGDGEHCALLKSLGLSVRAVDLSPRVIERVRPHVDEATVSDVQLLELGQQYDVILCFGVLEYVGDLRSSMWNLAAHVREGAACSSRSRSPGSPGVCMPWPTSCATPCAHVSSTGACSTTSRAVPACA
jgi:2-polyprenyl-3-methyl-5-hydroxy-6-metoxy-1,4-benzoquinol methylase